MKTPEQGFIEIIKELREKGIRYKQLMRERDQAERDDPDEDDDTVSRSTQSIDHDIDNLLNDTMTAARKLICDKDTDGDGDCQDCHRTGGCPILQPPSPAVDDIGKAFVKLLYDQEILLMNSGRLMFYYKGSGFMSADDLRAVVAEMDRVNRLKG